MKYYYENVPGLGNVAVSRHAQDRMCRDNITEAEFQHALLTPDKPDLYEDSKILWRERGTLRIVVLVSPTPNRGAKLVKTVFRVKPQERSRP